MWVPSATVLFLGIVWHRQLGEIQDNIEHRVQQLLYKLQKKLHVSLQFLWHLQKFYPYKIRDRVRARVRG